MACRISVRQFQINYIRWKLLLPTVIYSTESNFRPATLPVLFFYLCFSAFCFFFFSDKALFKLPKNKKKTKGNPKHITVEFVEDPDAGSRCENFTINLSAVNNALNQKIQMQEKECMVFRQKCRLPWSQPPIPFPWQQTELVRQR